MGSAGRRVLPRFFSPFLKKIFEMSELCNNSACFFVEIKGTSDIYSSSKKFDDNITIHGRSNLLLQ